MQVLKQGTGGAFGTARAIFGQEGISGFWRGNALNVLRSAPFKVGALSLEVHNKSVCGCVHVCMQLYVDARSASIYPVLCE
jgi:hypothetical protein